MTRALASVLVDDAIVRALLPLACPSDFGPDNRYELEELIGAGRDSLVYRAVDRKFASENFRPKVCIKVTRSEAGSRTEARAARRVAHPNVVAILDQGIDASGYSYVVSEYVDGGDLSDVAVPWAPRKAAALMIKIARGVQAVHAAGVAHCDLKPANILLTAGGEPKIVDFELSRWAEQSDERHRGNAAFMSPEQYRRDPNSLSFPSDIYALGGLCYWLLSGKHAAGETSEEIEEFHRGGLGSPDLPIRGDLARVCLRALSTEAADRHNSAGEFAEDLERWLTHEPIPWTRPTLARSVLLWTRRRPRLALLLLLVILEVATMVGLSNVLAERERAYAVRLEAEARAQSAKIIEALRAKMLNGIRTLNQGAFAAAAADKMDSLIPALVWLQWLTDSPALPADGRLLTAEVRVEALSVLVNAAKKKGHEDSVDILLAKYSLAFFQIALGKTEEPAALLGEIRREWGEKLGPRDITWSAVRAMERCVQANRQIVAGALSGDLREELDQERVELMKEGNLLPIIHLIDSIQDRARHIVNSKTRPK